jgi:hypothetical protein
MMWERTEVVNALTRVAPALATRDLVPILTQYWFSGTRLMAHDDTIAISIPFRTNFQGAVSSKLLGLLRRSRAYGMEFKTVSEGDKEYLIANAGNYTIKLELEPPEKFLFQMPKPTVSALDVGSHSFLAALKLAMLTTSMDTSIADQLGVSLIPDGDGLLMCSINGPTMTRTRVAYLGPQRLKHRAILHSHFCQQLLRMVKPGDPVHLEGFGEPGPRIFTGIPPTCDGYSLARTESGEYLYGRLVGSERPVDFAGIVAKHAPTSELVPIPNKLKMIVERALVLDKRQDPPATEISVAAGRMSFIIDGAVMDSMPIADTHPPVTGAAYNLARLAEPLKHYDRFLVTEEVMVLTNGRSLLLIAARG